MAASDVTQWRKRRGKISNCLSFSYETRICKRNALHVHCRIDNLTCYALATIDIYTIAYSKEMWYMIEYQVRIPGVHKTESTKIVQPSRHFSPFGDASGVKVQPQPTLKGDTPRQPSGTGLYRLREFHRRQNVSPSLRSVFTCYFIEWDYLWSNSGFKWKLDFYLFIDIFFGFARLCNG